MAKDPAFLFFPGDWLGGTITFTRAHKGAYMDLLMGQFNLGHMGLQDIQDILNGDFEIMWESKLKFKFKIDENGLYYNEKLELEMQKRKRFTDSRKSNLVSHKPTHMEVHTRSRMENENEYENEKVNGKEKEITEIKTATPPEMNSSVRVYFKKFVELYPRGRDRVFQGTDECEWWFREWQKIMDYKLLISAVKFYAQSDKVQTGYPLRPINWLREWKDWVPKVIPGKVPADEKWIQEEQYDFGECECGGKFVSEHTVTGKTRCPCNRCGKEYRAPPDAVEKAKEILQKQFDRIGAR